VSEAALLHSPSFDHLALAQAQTRSFLTRGPRLFIGGTWEDWVGSTLEATDPSTGRPLAQVAEADAAAVNRAVGSARRALDEGAWGKLLPVDRERLLLRLADLIERDSDILAELDSIEMGKPLAMSRGIVKGAAAFVRYMAGWATKLHGRTFTPSPRQPGLRLHAYTLREPVGVAACIIPWNVAVLMAAWKLAPALATGCPVLLKPAEGTSLSALWIADLITEAGFPEGAVSVLPGRGAVTGRALVEHPGVNKIAFTGSTAVGRQIAREAGERMVRATMELGGKSPVLLMPDADLEQAARAAAHAAFYNSGQICGAGTRLIAPHRLVEPLTQAILEIARRYRAGAALAEGTNYGPLASHVQQDKVVRMVEAASGEGATVLRGGLALPDEGFFEEPVVVTGVRPDMAIFQEEVFGPVMTVSGYDEVDEAVRLANDSQYGLAAGVFGRDGALLQRVARGLKAGTVWLNCYHIYDATMPFGGTGSSGMGRELGEEVLDNFLETKTVAEAF
jgi:phenylacetaldehyde dehydrogenase